MVVFSQILPLYKNLGNSKMARKNNDKADNFEKVLFKAADKLRKNMDAAEYKHIVPEIILLKCISGVYFGESL